MEMRSIHYKYIVFFFPFIYLFLYYIPVYPFPFGIDNDFTVLYYNYKVYLLDKLSNFNFPLWSPSEGCGYPFFSNPFTQSFYPLNIPLALFYKIFSGYSKVDHQVFTILGISIFSLGLFYWLRSLKIDQRSSAVAAIIMGLSFKITEILRFPNAIHTMAWFPWILYGITILAKDQKFLKPFLIISICFLMSLTAGYVYYVYYSLFLFIPYSIVLFFKGGRRIFYGKKDEPDFSWIKTARILCISFLLPVIIISPYLFKMFQLLSQTTDRSGHSVAFSAHSEFSFSDSIGSLIYPPSANPEGWYYFGIIGVLIIILYITHSFSKSWKNNFDLWLISILVLWIILITAISYGQNSILFRLMWKIFPGFSYLRVWARINIILVPLWALLLAKSIFFFSRLARCSFKNMKVNYPKVISIITISFILIFFIQVSLYYGGIFSGYWYKYINTTAKFPGTLRMVMDFWFMLMGLVSFLFLFILFYRKGKITAFQVKLVRYAFLFVVLISALDTFPTGSQQWIKRKLNHRTRLDIDKCNIKSFQTNRVYLETTIRLDSVFSTGYVENWYFKKYIDFLNDNLMTYDKIKSKVIKDPDMNLFLGCTNGKKIYFTKTNSFLSVRDFIADSQESERRASFTFSISKYTGDELIMSIHSDANGWLSFVDNYDQDWYASINGSSMGIRLLFNTFKIIPVPKGDHTIQFRYHPSFF